LGKNIPEVKQDRARSICCCPCLTQDNDKKLKSEKVDYTKLKYVTVGANKIDEDIWADSLLGQLQK